MKIEIKIDGEDILLQPLEITAYLISLKTDKSTIVIKRGSEGAIKNLRKVLRLRKEEP